MNLPWFKTRSHPFVAPEGLQQIRIFQNREKFTQHVKKHVLRHFLRLKWATVMDMNAPYWALVNQKPPNRPAIQAAYDIWAETIVQGLESHRVSPIYVDIEELVSQENSPPCV